MQARESRVTDFGEDVLITHSESPDSHGGCRMNRQVTFAEVRNARGEPTIVAVETCSICGYGSTETEAFEALNRHKRELDGSNSPDHPVHNIT